MPIVMAFLNSGQTVRLQVPRTSRLTPFAVSRVSTPDRIRFNWKPSIELPITACAHAANVRMLTKTYAMAATAGLSITLIPVLMGYWIRGRIPEEQKNPITGVRIAVYRPALEAVLRWPKATLAVALVLLATTAWPLMRQGEFLPPLDEGVLLYMPSALPGLSAQNAAELLQLTNRMIKTVPEVERVFGKAGRAEMATDPAPLEMVETTIQLEPRAQWRPGMTPEKLVEELDRTVKVPGLSSI